MQKKQFAADKRKPGLRLAQLDQPSIVLWDIYILTKSMQFCFMADFNINFERIVVIYQNRMKFTTLQQMIKMRG